MIYFYANGFVGAQIHYNDARFPWLTLKASKTRLMMEILRGSPALSAFRINKLLARLRANLPVSAMPNIFILPIECPPALTIASALARLLQWPELAAMPRPVNYRRDPSPHHLSPVF